MRVILFLTHIFLFSPCARHCSKEFVNSNLVNNRLRGKYFYYPHFTDEQTEDQRGQVTFLKSHSKYMVESRFEPRCLDSRPCPGSQSINTS